MGSKRKSFVVLSIVIAAIMSVGVGFSTWLIASGTLAKDASVNIDADASISKNGIPKTVISDLTIEPISCSPKYGFSPEGIFQASTPISGSFVFSVATAKPMIDSLASGQMSLAFSLTSQAFSSSFSSSGIVLSGGFSKSSGALSYDSSIGGFAYSFSFTDIVVETGSPSYVATKTVDFSTTLTFSSPGTIGDEGTFPDFGAASNAISLSILPGEYEA